jgi:long-chain fatty acid transport protein
MKRPAGAVILVLAVLTAFHPLYAQGLRPFELGARAATLGGAFAARADDASAVFFNPAGLAFLSGLRVKINISYNQLTTTADVPGFATASKSDPTRFTGNFYVAASVKDIITFGIGAFSANTMKTSWLDTWPGSTRSIISSITSTYVRPILSLKISESLAVGGGADFIVARQIWDYDKIFTFMETNPYYIFPTISKTNISGSGVGFVAGWLFKLGDRFGFGGKYTSKVAIDLNGTTDFDTSIYTGRTPIRGLATRAKMTIPQEFVVGLRVSPLRRLTFHLDFQRTGTQDAVDWMFNIDPGIFDEVERQLGFRPDEDTFGVGLQLKSTSRIMFGVEYLVGKAVGVRAGYSRQGSSVADDGLHPVFPDLATQAFSFGIGYEGPFFDLVNVERKIGGLSVDAYFQHGTSSVRTSKLLDFPATYGGSRWSFGVGFGFAF